MKVENQKKIIIGSLWEIFKSLWLLNMMLVWLALLCLIGKTDWNSFFVLAGFDLLVNLVFGFVLIVFDETGFTYRTLFLKIRCEYISIRKVKLSVPVLLVYQNNSEKPFWISLKSVSWKTLGVLLELLKENAPLAEIDAKVHPRSFKHVLKDVVGVFLGTFGNDADSEKSMSRPKTEKKQFPVKTLTVGIVLFIINWFYHVFHNTDFQIARNADLDKPEFSGLIVSTILSSVIFLIWLVRKYRNEKVDVAALLKGAVVTLVIVNYVILFVMKKNVETVNALLDKSPAQTRQVVVSDKREVRTGGTSYDYVYFPDQDGNRFSLYVDYRFYDSVNKGARLQITTHPGYFGWPWIERFKKISN